MSHLMKEVTAFGGSARKKNTYRAAEQYMNNLKALGAFERRPPAAKQPKNDRVGKIVMPEYYEIKIKDYLDPRWSEWFAGMELTHLEGDGTLLAGLLPD